MVFTLIRPRVSIFTSGRSHTQICRLFFQTQEESGKIIYYCVFRIFLFLGWARAIGIARSGAFGVLAAIVPASAFGHIQRILAGQADSVEDLALGAAEFVGLLAKEAGEEELAVGRMRENGVGLQ